MTWRRHGARRGLATLLAHGVTHGFDLQERKKNEGILQFARVLANDGTRTRGSRGKQKVKCNCCVKDRT